MSTFNYINYLPMINNIIVSRYTRKCIFKNNFLVEHHCLIADRSLALGRSHVITKVNEFFVDLINYYKLEFNFTRKNIEPYKGIFLDVALF